jgi:hypothetical protein
MPFLNLTTNDPSVNRYLPAIKRVRRVASNRAKLAAKNRPV